jgi:hypothetical protein
MTDIIYQGQVGRIVANRVNLNSKDGTILSISTSSGYSLQGARHPYQSLSISKALSVTEGGKILSNIGASSLISITLPTTTEAGIIFKFVRVAAFDMRITPPAASKIRYSGGDMADAEYLSLASNGAKLHLVSDGNGDWIATYEFGTLTEQTP